MLKVLSTIAGLFLATVVDQGITIWTGVEAVPSFLQLTFVLICMTHREASIVLWGGMVGLCDDLTHLSSLGTGIIIFSSVSLIWATYCHTLTAPSGIFDKLFFSALLVGLVRFLRWQFSSSIEGFQWDDAGNVFGMPFIGTLLLCLVAILVMSVLNRSDFDNSRIREESPHLFR